MTSLLFSTGLLRPSQVVGSRFGAGQLLDLTLEERPEAERFKRVVEPAGRDAEVRFVRRHVVDAVVTSGQDNVQVLQPHNRFGQSEVRV